MPTPNGTGLTPYSGPPLTVQSELNKLGHNVTFGHGIHPGIHYRSDSDASLLLGEAVALSILQDKAAAYNEKFSVTLTKLDGTTATISNQGEIVSGGRLFKGRPFLRLGHLVVISDPRELSVPHPRR